MKYVLKISAVAAIAILLNACGSNNDEKNGTNSKTIALKQVGKLNVSEPKDDTTEVTAEDMSLSNNGKTIFLADGSAGLKIINVEDPTHPVLISSYDDPSNAGLNRGGFGRRIDISDDGNTIYMADGLAGLKVIDISTPSSPVLLGKLDTKGFSHGITVSHDGKKVYISDNGEDGGTPGLRIVDVTDPTSPALIEERDEQWATQVNISSDDKTLYVTDKKAGILIVDVSKPENIINQLIDKYLGTYKVTDKGISADIVLSKNGKTAYVANKKVGIKILDVSNVKDPKLLAKYDTDGFEGKNIAKSITLSEDGKRLFVANRSTGVEVFDVSDSKNPKLLTSLDTSGSAEDVMLSKDGKLLYVADGKAGIKVIRISN